MEVTRTMPLNRHTMALSAKSVDAVKGRAGVKTDTVLRIEHLSKNFGSHIVLRDIDFSVRSGEVVCIIGASGSGKSTMLRCINHLETPTSGEITYEGKAVGGVHFDLSQYRAKVGMVFQSFNLFNNMTVLQNCMAGPVHVLHKKKAEAKQDALFYLKKVGMAPYINARPSQLSGGQKQRVAIAGVLAMQPKTIVLDEPTAMLDPQGRQEVVSIVEKLSREQNITVILITHHMDEAICADRVIAMDDGKIIADGAPKDVFTKIDLLQSVGLTAPQTTLLLKALDDDGCALPLDALSVDDCAQALLRQILQAKA